MDIRAIYRREIRRQPFYKRGQEKWLWVMYKWGSTWARDELFRSMAPLVVTMASRYQPTNCLGTEDLIQHGNLGVLRAIEKFDGTRGYRLTTYAYRWIWQFICREIIRSSYQITIPYMTTPKLADLRAAMKSGGMYQALGANVSVMKCKSTSPARAAENQDEVRRGREKLRHALGALNDREQYVLIERASGKILDDLAAVLGVTRERVRQIESKALHKARMRAGSGPTPRGWTVSSVDPDSRKRKPPVAVAV